MSLYFFHLRDGQDVLLDPEGREFPDLESVGRAALTEARAIISHDALTGLIHLEQRIDVEDSSGQLVHRLNFKDAVEIQ